MKKIIVLGLISFGLIGLGERGFCSGNSFSLKVKRKMIIPEGYDSKDNFLGDPSCSFSTYSEQEISLSAGSSTVGYALGEDRHKYRDTMPPRRYYSVTALRFHEGNNKFSIFIGCQRDSLFGYPSNPISLVELRKRLAPYFEIK